MVKMKIKFVSTKEAKTGVLKGKLANAVELAGKVLGQSAEAGVAALMIKEGGAIGIVIVGCLALVKIAIEACE